MKVLVTGGCGYVGSHAVRELAAAGHEILIYDNLSTGHSQLAGGFEFVEGEIADVEKVRRCLDRVDAVMHFAASAYVGESVENPKKYFDNNVTSALRLMDAVLASDVRRVVFSSSCAVYGVPAALPITEDSPKSPINPYGWTKLFFEQVLSAYAASHGLRTFALRYFNAAGAHDDGTIGECHEPETHIIPLMLKAILGTAPPLRIFGRDLDTPDGTCIRDFIHVTDLGKAHVKALEHLANGGDSATVNLGTGRGTSIAELLAAVRSVTGKEVPHIFAPARVGDPPALYAEVSRAARLLDWHASYDLEQVLASAWRWELKKDAFFEQGLSVSR